MIVIVCGIPGSGKTTLSTGLRDRLAERGHAFELVHSDDYQRRTYDRMYEHVAEGMAESADGDRNWILDGTFPRREWRNRFYRLDDVYEVWAKATLSTCRRRNRERIDPIPERGLQSVHGEFEPPRADLEIDTEAVDVATALDRLEAAVLDWVASA